MDVLKVIERYDELEKGFSWIMKNSTSNDLPYHNFNHLLTVVRYVYEACKRYELEEKDEKELLVAALFHDVNHSGGKETDDVNVRVAKDAIRNFIKENNFSVDSDEVCRIVDATQYPYVIDVSDLDLKQKIIRDADLMQVYEYNWIQQNMMGLCSELNVTMDRMIEGQKKFLSSAEFNTDWGKEKHSAEWDNVIRKLDELERLYCLN